MTKQDKKKTWATDVSNFCDSLVGVFNPQAAIQRKLARHVLNRAEYYEGAKRRNGSGLFNHSTSANRELSYDLPALREHSRALTKNDSFASGAIQSKVTNVVGCGLRYQSQMDTNLLGIDAKTSLAYSKAIETHWNLWTSKPWCDATRQSNFVDLQRLMFRSMLESGDVFVALVYDKNDKSPYQIKIQLIEADLIRNPDRKVDDFNLPGIAGGLERNANGQIEAIHVANSYDDTLQVSQTTKIPIFNAKTGRQQVFQLLKMHRPMQNRGTPDLTPILSALKQFSDYNQAEAEAALMNALFAVFIESDNPDVFGGTGIPGQGLDNADDRGVTPAKDIALNGKAVHILKKGEKIQSVSAVRPNQSYGSFVDALTKQLAMGLNVSSEVLMKHFDSSYSASRAAMLESWRTFYEERALLVRQLLQPILEEFVYYLVLTGKIDLPNFLSDNPSIPYAYTKGVWIGDAEGQIDEVKEVKAVQMRLDSGISTLEAETAKRGGGDWQDNLRQRQEEVAFIQELGLEGRINYAQQVVQNAGGQQSVPNSGSN